MSILIDDGSRVLVQGITGREGQFHTERMIRYGTRVVGGVTPGRGGQSTLGVPVFCLGVPTVLDAGTARRTANTARSRPATRRRWRATRCSARNRSPGGRGPTANGACCAFRS